jgi:hypothetical protein
VPVTLVAPDPAIAIALRHRADLSRRRAGHELLAWLDLARDERPRRTYPVFGAVDFCRDAAGTCWRTRPDSQFDKIPAKQMLASLIK